MRDRGVDRHVAMKITGHRTESVYNRYNIVDLKDIAKATAALDAEQKSQKNQSSQDDQNSHSSAITEPAKPPQKEAGNVEVTAIQEDDGRPGGIRTPDPRFRKWWKGHRAPPNLLILKSRRVQQICQIVLF